MTITEPAPAKINLALHIRGRRADGYHDIETLFAFARHGDLVTVQEAERDSFTVTGPFAHALDHPHSAALTRLAPLSMGEGRGPPPQAAGRGEDDNLVIRSRDAFRAAFACPPLAITLEKNLPVASGIGGGSADAAATLRALAQLTGVDLADARMVAIARTLGADVPACLAGRTAFATGRGDDLVALQSLGDLPLLLVNPLIPLSTAAMFAGWDGIDRGPIARTGTALERAASAGNDFTAPAIAAAPVIAEVLALLADAPGASLVRMSGSGATCFALFDTDAMRDDAAALAAGRGWWTLATTLA